MVLYNKCEVRLTLYLLFCLAKCGVFGPLYNANHQHQILPYNDWTRHRLTKCILLLTSQASNTVSFVSISRKSWWRHQIETFSALLALCAGNYQSPLDSPHKGQWRGALMFSLICAWTNGWANNRDAVTLKTISHTMTSLLCDGIIIGSHCIL